MKMSEIQVFFVHPILKIQIFYYSGCKPSVKNHGPELHETKYINKNINRLLFCGCETVVGSKSRGQIMSKMSAKSGLCPLRYPSNRLTNYPLSISPMLTTDFQMFKV